MSLWEFISIWVSTPPPHFRAISSFGPNIFQAEKKSVGDMVHRWLLKTAYTILLSNETLDQSISYPFDILLASEWDLPPSFSHIFSFRTKHFWSRKKLYWRYGPLMVFKNCLYHSFFKRNLWSINIISLQDFISISVSPPPSFSCIFMFRTKHFSTGLPQGFTAHLKWGFSYK